MGSLGILIGFEDVINDLLLNIVNLFGKRGYYSVKLVLIVIDVISWIWILILIMFDKGNLNK